MLEKATRKKLLEHNWVEIARKDSNPHQTLRRNVRMANTAINDLVLIAQRLPNEAQKEIFSYTNVNKLLKALLNWPPRKSTGVDDVAQTELAGLFVRLGIWICIEQYRTKVEQDSDLNDLTISHLLKAIDICSAISFKLKSPQVEEDAKKEDLIYLFNWTLIKEVHETKTSEVKGGDTKKFVEFLIDICLTEGFPIDIINTINFSPIHYYADTDIHTGMAFECTDLYGDHFDGTVWLDFEKKTGNLSLRIPGDEETRTVKHNLVIKIENENVYVYRNQ